MGIFSDIGDFLSGTSSGSQKVKTKKSEEVSGTQISGTTGSESSQTGTKQATTGRQVTELLSPEIQSQLEGIIGALSSQFQTGANVGAEGSREALDFARGLAERAPGTQEFVDARTAQILDAARLNSERELTRSNALNAAAAGSDFNSIVSDLRIRGRNDLETQLAGVEGQLALAGRELEDTALVAAGEALREASETGQLSANAVTDSIANLANVLRGATATTETTGEQEQQTTTQSISELLQIVETLQRGRAISTGSQDTSQDSSVLDFLNVLARFD